MSTRRKNAGQGYGYMLHGSFTDKKDAVAKERKTKGAWIKHTLTNQGWRYIVMSPRTNPPKRHKQNPATKVHKKFTGRDASGRAYAFAQQMRDRYPGRKVDVLERADGSWLVFVVNEPVTRNPSELIVMGANPHPKQQEIKIPLPGGGEVTIRTNPAQLNPDHYSSAQARAAGASYHPPGLIQSLFQSRVHKISRAGRSSRGTRSGTREPMSTLRAEVASALVNQGYKPAQAKRMARAAQGGDFSAMFNDAMRRNPSAEALRERFVGREVDRVTIHNEPHMPKGDYAMVGKALNLYVKPRTSGQVQVIDLRGVTVVSDESARQLYFVGGDQDVSGGLAVFGALDRGAGIFELGEARRIDYRQRKEHVPHPEMEDWRHDLGEENGIRPIVLYDSNAKRLLFEGGDYRIEEAGIIN